MLTAHTRAIADGASISAPSPTATVQAFIAASPADSNVILGRPMRSRLRPSVACTLQGLRASMAMACSADADRPVAAGCGWRAGAVPARAARAAPGAGAGRFPAGRAGRADARCGRLGGCTAGRQPSAGGRAAAAAGAATTHGGTDQQRRADGAGIARPAAGPVSGAAGPRVLQCRFRPAQTAAKGVPARARGTAGCACAHLVHR
ncbi:hypothetical protein G6F31_012638 [Rhizopus arrhizus]|nr:hypothetical protein G6F31_012638 [Rhizopus arrhizus]